MVLHANLQSEMVLAIIAIFQGNHIQQLITLKVIMIETRCLQFWNSQLIIISKHGM